MEDEDMLAQVEEAGQNSPPLDIFVFQILITVANYGGMKGKDSNILSVLLFSWLCACFVFRGFALEHSSSSSRRHFSLQEINAGFLTAKSLAGSFSLGPVYS